MVRKISEEPYDHRKDQDHTAHLLEILLSLLPCVAEDGLGGRYAVRRQLHDKRKVILPEEAAHHLRGSHGQQYSKCIHTQQHQTGMTREEGSRYQDIHRHPSGARHQRDYEHCYKAAFAALDCPGGHDRRHIASESHDHRYEGLAVKPYLMHQTVHDEGYTGHIAGVLHQRNEKIEYHYVRQEHQHAAGPAYDSVHNKVLEPALRHD